MIYGQSSTTKQSRPVQTDDSGFLQTKQVDGSGADATGAKISAATMPSGGSGLLGWLSAIWYRLALRAAKELTRAAISESASGDRTIVAAAIGQTTRVHRMYFTVAAATTITIKRGSTSLTGAMTLNAGGAFFLDYSSEPWFVTAVNEAFVINSSAAVQISGSVEYVTSA